MLTVCGQLSLSRLSSVVVQPLRGFGQLKNVGVDVDNFIAEFFGRVLSGDIKILVVILGVLFILYIIGRQSLTRLLMSVVRGAAYLLTAATIVYIFKYYPKEVLYHAQRFWADLNNFFGAG